MDYKLLFEAAKARGITEIEVYNEKNAGTNVSLFQLTVDKQTTYETNCSYVRGVVDGKIGSCYVENDLMSIDEIIDTIIDNAKTLTTTEPYFIYGGDESYPEIKEEPLDLGSLTMADKIEALKNVASKVSNYEGIAQCPSTSYGEEAKTVTIVNSNGLNVSKSVNEAYFVSQAIAKKDDETKVNYDFKLVHNEADLKDVDDFVKSLCDDTVSQLGGSPVDSGVYKVVIDKSCMSQMLGAFASFFSAEAAIRKMSYLDGKIDTKVYSDKITIIDDPLYEFSPNKNAFDDEGCASYAKTVVDKGVFKTFLHNLKTAKMMGVKTTANGYKASINSAVGVRPTNLYIEKGDKSLDELFEICGDGIYITSLAGLHAGLNPISGDFSLQSSGYVIKDGKKDRPVTLIVLAGNFKDMLNNVVEVGSDLEFKASSVASPSILISNLAISGK